MARDSTGREMQVIREKRVPGLSLKEKLEEMNGGVHILVVDGKEIEGNELRYLLEGEGYAVDQALCGAEALSKIERERFDLVLTEVPVPDMDELELIRDIREADHDIVEIVMGDHLSLGTAIEAWRCDVWGYVPQPLDDPDGVLAAVASGLADRKALQDMGS